MYKNNDGNMFQKCASVGINKATDIYKMESKFIQIKYETK